MSSYVGFPPPEGWVPPSEINWPEPKNGIIDFKENPQEIYRSCFWQYERKRIIRISENICFVLYPILILYWALNFFLNGKLFEIYAIAKPLLFGLFLFFAILNYAHRLFYHLRFFTKYWNDENEYPNPWFYVLRKKGDMYEFTDYRIGLFKYRKLVDANDIKLIVNNRTCKLKIKNKTFHYPSYNIASIDDRLFAGLPWPSDNIEKEKNLNDWEMLDYSKNNYIFEWRIHYEGVMKFYRLIWPY